ncbi:hypothetical protein [Azospirillum argentinense]
MSQTWTTWEPAFILSESGAFYLVSWVRVFWNSVVVNLLLLLSLDNMPNSPQIITKYNRIYIICETASNPFSIDRRSLPEYSLSCERA